MSTERIAVAPDVLGWARRTSGMESALAARRLGVSEASLAKWESGELRPTIKQLRKAAKVFRRPLAVLLLPAPPRDFQPLRDFRRPPSGAQAEWSPALHAEFKRALSQREVFLELAELAPASVPQPSEELSVDSHAPPDEAAEHLREMIGLQGRPDWAGPREALNAVVATVERLGVLVIQTQDVGIGEMRGFSVSERPFPVVALNGADWPRPRLFTLLHELCHVALNAGGVCDLHESRGRAPTSEDVVEQFCNRVAAAVLMPRELMLGEPLVQRYGGAHSWTLDELRQLSNRFGASSEALLLRLITLDKATWDLYWARKPELEAEYAEARRRERQRQQEGQGGPSYYVVKARDLGHGYVASVLDAFRSRAISSLDVADYLDVRYEQLSRLEQAALR
jgi:Zn-dependent peptidase ImmA (M78 family)/DNA-binding XRE family transcriptional regulator